MTDFGSNFYYFHIMRIISSTSANPMSAAAMLLSPDLHNLTQLTEALTRVQHPTREPQNQVEEFLSIPREHRRTPYVNEERCRTCLRSATMLPRTINHRATCPELTGINNADHIFNNSVGAIRNRFYCTLCGWVFPSRTDLRHRCVFGSVPEATLIQLSPLPTQDMPEVTAINNANRLFRNTLGNLRNRVYCTLCGWVFPSRTDLRHPCRSRVRSTPEASLVPQRPLPVHDTPEAPLVQRRPHPQESPVDISLSRVAGGCRLCPFSSRYLQNFRRHMQDFHELSATPKHRCDLCPYKGRYDNVVRHKRAVHGIKSEDGVAPAAKGREQQKCPFCSEMFGGDGSDNLRSHIETDHSEVERFACKLCGFATERKDTLKKHMAIHEYSIVLEKLNTEEEESQISK